MPGPDPAARQDQENRTAMNDSTALTQQQTHPERASTCPSWCDQKHLADAPSADGAVHHDAAVGAASCRPGSTSHQLHVSANQEDRPGGRGWAPRVAVSTDEGPLADLSAAEAVALARLLLNAAALVEDG